MTHSTQYNGKRTSLRRYVMKAIGMVELNSIAKGIFLADLMVKASEVKIATSMSTCPGKYIVIVYGDTEAVRTSVKEAEAEADQFFVDSIIIPNVHEFVFPAVSGVYQPERIAAVGIIETFSMATMLIATDELLKAAELEPVELRLGNGLGGKAFLVFTGDTASVETGISTAKAVAKETGLLINTEIIPSPAEEVVEFLT
jgi:microcompartment protein CcmL/EutN